MTAGIDRRRAAGLVEDALRDVFDPGVVSGLREDSPLSALGMTPADAVCVADAVSSRAVEGGLACDLTDEVFRDSATVADLVCAVEAAACREVGP